jgi:hypothetical protein
MVRHHCAVSHAILPEFGLQWLDLRLCERVQPPERAMPDSVGCCKFTMRSGAARMLFRLFESGLSPRLWRRSATRSLVPGETVGRRPWPRARRPRAWPRRRTCTRTIETAAGRTRTASCQSCQPDHHSERFVHRFRVAEHTRHVRVERDRSVSGGRAHALTERLVARGTSRTRRPLRTLVRIGSVEITRFCSRCTEFSVHRRACARTAACASGSVTIFTAIFVFEPFHQ